MKEIIGNASINFITSVQQHFYFELLCRFKQLDIEKMENDCYKR